MVIHLSIKDLLQVFPKEVFGLLYYLTYVYIRLLGNGVLHCDLFQHADDASLVKEVQTKKDRIKAAEEINADLNRVYLWSGTWNINFEPTKCFSLCVSLKRDADCHHLCPWLLFQWKR